MIAQLIPVSALAWAVVFFALRTLVYPPLGTELGEREAYATLVTMTLAFALAFLVAAGVGAGLASFVHRAHEEGAMCGIGALSFVLGFGCLRTLFREWAHTEHAIA